jgi:hypothetical protein
MATLANLRTETQKLLDDTNAKRWTTADLDLYLNEAQLVLNQVRGDYKTAIPITTVGATATYTLSPIPIGPIARVEDSSGQMLTRTTEDILNTFQDEWRSETELQATQWCLGTNNFNSIRLWPTPLRDGYTYSVWAPTTPPTMTVSVDSVIPEYLTRALPYYAAHKALLRDRNDRDSALSDKYLAVFNQIIGG